MRTLAPPPPPPLLLLLLLLAWQHVSVSAYRIVRVDGAVYLVHRHICRKIDNESTWLSLGYTDAKGCAPAAEGEGVYGHKEVYSWRTAAGTTAQSGKWVGLSVCISNASSLAELQCTPGSPLPLIEKHNNTPDENIRIELLRIKVLLEDSVPGGDLLKDPTYLGSYINPSVVPWNGQLLLMTGLAFGFGLVDGLAPSETVLFRLLSPHSVSAGKTKHAPTDDLQYDVRMAGEYTDAGYSVSGIGQRLQPLNECFLGQDPRVLQIGPDHLAVVFTNRFTPAISVGLAILAMNNTVRPDYLHTAYPSGEGAGASVPAGHMILAGGDNRYDMEASKTPPYRYNQNSTGANLVLSQLYPSMSVAGSEGEHHKNWSPFVYVEKVAGTGAGAGAGANAAHKLYFVKHINPLVIVTPDWDTVAHKTNHVSVRVVSQAPKVNLNFWGYGPIRGGTAALRLPDGRYLAFFHSSCKIGTWHTTYVMGAYTFTGKPPFRLQSISAVPLMSPSFYQGNWAEFKNRNIDYVVFPMSFFFEDDIGKPFDESLVSMASSRNAASVSHHAGHAASPPPSAGTAGFGHAYLHKRFVGGGGDSAADSHLDNNNRTIVLSFGAQDRAGWLARISLLDLLGSLVNVNDNDHDNVTTLAMSESHRRLFRLDWHRRRLRAVA